jgi:hypothetical protein
MLSENSSLPPARARILLLAPSYSVLPASGFSEVVQSDDLYQGFLAAAQKLRGRVYMRDGAIAPTQLTRDGRYRAQADDEGWHVLSLDLDGRVRGCARYLPHASPVAFDDLLIRGCPLGRSPDWGAAYRAAVNDVIDQAQTQNLACVEVGGWAVDEEKRHGIEALRIALASYALADLLGGCLGLTAATHRHASAQMLCRIGGWKLSWDGRQLPGYFDPGYQCQMEVLQFDSRVLNPKYVSWKNEILAQLRTAPVVCAGFSASALDRSLGAFGTPVLAHPQPA